LILASEILNKKVYASDTESEVGRIAEIIVDPENGRVVAFSIARFLEKSKVVAETDVLEVKKDGVFVTSENAITAPSEIIRVKEIIDKGIKILKSKAVTESKKVLGKIEDFLIETETASVVKFYVRGGLLSPSLILPSEKVVRIEKGRIIFSDDVLERKEIKEPAVA